ncbi:MAG: sulfurtransferase TusA family protein [Spirochaetaceae bacterium]|jgi:TusA-related sulfurtransferase|nr:sulfurtransferase TusA family protein [Spirochaetaceae bacterium]
MKEDSTADAQIDITSVVCPMTFVQTKVALDELEDGQVLEVRLNSGEAMQNVPRSLKGEGHQVFAVHQNSDSTYRILVRKGGLG